MGKLTSANFIHFWYTYDTKSRVSQFTSKAQADWKDITKGANWEYSRCRKACNWKDANITEIRPIIKVTPSSTPRDQFKVFKVCLWADVLSVYAKSCHECCWSKCA